VLVAVDPGAPLVAGDRAAAPADFGAMAGEHQQGDAVRLVAAGGGRVVVDVHLDDLQMTGALAGQLLENRCHGAAGSAPWRPQVEQDRHAGLQFGVQGGVGRRGQPGQGPVAGAAPRRAGR
jgi:hypothetical protein